MNVPGMQRDGFEHPIVVTFNPLIGVQRPNTSRENPINRALFNALPIDQVETRLYRRANAALCDQSLIRLSKDDRLPYITWAMRDVERIPAIRDEFAQTFRQNNIPEQPAGVIAEFFARRALRHSLAGLFANCVSMSLRRGDASLALNMLALRIERIALHADRGQDALRTAHNVHVILQVPQDAAHSISDIGTGTERTRVWWKRADDDQYAQNRRPAVPMPQANLGSSSDVRIHEINEQEAASGAKNTQASGSSEAHNHAERANFNPNFRFEDDDLPDEQRAGSSSMPAHFGLGQPGIEAYNSAIELDRREGLAGREIPNAQIELRKVQGNTQMALRTAEQLRTELRDAEFALESLRRDAQAHPNFRHALRGERAFSADSENQQYVRAQRVLDNANRLSHAAEVDVRNSSQHPNQNMLACVKRDIALANARLASAQLDQASIKLNIARIKGQANAIHRAVDACRPAQNPFGAVVSGIKNAIGCAAGKILDRDTFAESPSSSGWQQPSVDNVRRPVIWHNASGEGFETQMTPDELKQFWKNDRM